MFNPLSITARYREALRLRQVVNTFIAYGVGTVLSSSSVALRLREIFTRKKAEYEPSHVRFRKALETLGPTFIKLGQILSTRVDLLPENWAVELMKLRDEVPPVEWDLVEKRLRSELGNNWSSLFDSFDVEPIGSASIAQVYRARLKTGEDVVVKIRRPGIEDIVDTDIEVLKRIAAFVDRRISEARIYQLPRLVDEFAFTIKREMDFTVEASNCERIREVLKNVEGVRIPRVFWDYTTSAVAVYEWIEGEKLDRYSGDDGCKIGKILARAFLTQVIEGGIFHADLHPANVIITDDAEVVLLDFGMVGFLDNEMREFVMRVFMAIIDRRYDDIVEEYKRMGFVEKMDERRFKLEIMALVEPYLMRSIYRVNIGEIVQKIIGVSLRYGVRMPPEFLMLARGLFVVDGSIRNVCNNINVLELVAPFAERFYKKKVKLQLLLKDMYTDVIRTRENISLLLALGVEAAARAREEGIRVKVAQDEIREKEFRQLRNRITMSIGAVGFFLASLFSWAFKIGWIKKLPITPLSFGLAAFLLFVLSLKD